MSMQDKFAKACQQLKDFKKRPTDADMLEFYALYKQGQVGDVNTPKPTDMEAKAKWEAWVAKKGTSKEAAQQAYVVKVNALAPTYG